MTDYTLTVASLLLQNATYSGVLRSLGDVPTTSSSAVINYGVVHSGMLYIFDDLKSAVPNTTFLLANTSFSECATSKEDTDSIFYLETTEENQARRHYFSVESQSELQKWITVLSVEKRRHANLIRTPPDGDSFVSSKDKEEKQTRDAKISGHDLKLQNKLGTRGRSQTTMEQQKHNGELDIPRRHSSPAVSPARHKKSTKSKIASFFGSGKKNSTPESSPKVDRRKSIPKIEVTVNNDTQNVYHTGPHIEYPPTSCHYFSPGYASITQNPTRRSSVPVQDIPREHLQLQRNHSAAIPRIQEAPLVSPSPRPRQEQRQSAPNIKIKDTLPIVSRPAATPPISPQPNIPAPRTNRRHSSFETNSYTYTNHMQVLQHEKVAPNTPRRPSSPYISSPDVSPSNTAGNIFNFAGANGRKLSPADIRKPVEGAEQVYNYIDEEDSSYVEMRSPGFDIKEREVQTSIRDTLHIREHDSAESDDLYVVPETEGDISEDEYLPPSVYQWGMDRAAANKLLLKLGESGLYVIRTATDEKKVISTYVLGETRHYKIFQEEGQMFLRKDHPLFENIRDLIRYYRNYDLPTCAARLIKPYR